MDIIIQRAFKNSVSVGDHVLLSYKSFRGFEHSFSGVVDSIDDDGVWIDKQQSYLFKDDDGIWDTAREKNEFVPFNEVLGWKIG